MRRLVVDALTGRRRGRRPDARQSRLGFTLLEIVLVLAVLATVGAMVLPRLQPGVSRAGLRAAALQLKADFAEAREAAIHDGRVREVRLKPASGRYLISLSPRDWRKLNQGPATLQRAESSGTVRGSPRDSTEDDGFRELPDDVVFRDPSAVFPPPNASLPEQSESRATETTETLEDVLEADASDWMLAARFFPDGRASETAIELEGFDAAQRIAVHVRGLTGGVTIGPVETIAVDGEDVATESAVRESVPRTRPTP